MVGLVYYVLKDSVHLFASKDSKINTKAIL